MNESGGRCYGERAESLTLDGSGRRGGEGEEGSGEKSAFKHLSQLAVLGRGEGGGPAHPRASAGHSRGRGWPPGSPRNSPTPQWAPPPKKRGNPPLLLAWLFLASPARLPGGAPRCQDFPAALPPRPQPRRQRRLSAAPARRPRPRAAPPGHGAPPPPARALTGAHRCRARPEPRKGGPAVLPAPHRREGGS